jgi:hypothetical protein
VLGAHYDDLLNLKNNWMKNISGERLLFMKYVLYFTLRAIQRMFKFFPEEFVVNLFLAAEEKVTGLKGFKSKTIRTMARSVLLFFYTELKHALALTALHGFVRTASLLYDLLFTNSSIK